MDERQIARAALDESDPELRSALLDRLCGADRDLRGRVEALIRPRPSLWGNVPIEAAPELTADSSPMPVPPAPRRDRPAAPLQARPKRPRIAVWVGLIGMASVLGLLAWWNLHRDPRAPLDGNERIAEEPIRDPEPKPSEPPRRNPEIWGKLIDPLGGASSSFDANGLTLNVPGDAPRDVRPMLRKNLDAIRLMQAVEQDFTLEVRVDAFPQPTSAHSTDSGQPGYQAAGLLIWCDPLNLVRFERLVLASEDPGPARIRSVWYGEGLLVADHQEEAGSSPIFLRIVRQGRLLRLQTSNDGRTWSDFQERECPGIGPSVEVGVYAVNTTDQPFTPRFEGWKLASGPGSGR